MVRSRGQDTIEESKCESDELFVKRCADIIINLCRSCSGNEVSDVPIKEAFRSLLPIRKDKCTIDLNGIVPRHISEIAQELIRAHLRARSASSEACRANKINVSRIHDLENSYERHVSGMDAWMKHISSWDDVVISIDALESVFARPALRVTSKRMNASVKRAVVSGGSLSGKIISRDINGMDQDQGNDLINVHVVFATPHKENDDASHVNKLLHYNKVSCILGRKCRLFALPTRGTFKEVDAVIDLVPSHPKSADKWSEWNQSAIRCFWDMAASFVRPSPERGTTGKILDLIGQVEDLHYEKVVHTDLTRSTVKYNSKTSSFHVCALDRTEALPDQKTDGMRSGNARQCALIIKAVLEFLIRVFFEKMRSCESVDEERRISTQWGASLASWSTLRNGISARVRRAGSESPWMTMREFRNWIISEVDTIYTISSGKSSEYDAIRDLYARTAVSYDRK